MFTISPTITHWGATLVDIASCEGHPIVSHADPGPADPKFCKAGDVPTLEDGRWDLLEMMGKNRWMLDELVGHHVKKSTKK